MRWLLAGCCGLALISISVAPNPAGLITQRPRFYGVKIGHNVIITCQSSQKHLPANVEWFKVSSYNDDKQDKKIEARKTITFFNSDPHRKFLGLHAVRVEDIGVYFCRLNGTWGPGTELQVSRAINIASAVHRTKIKDSLIILQGLLLAACIAAVIMRKRQLMKRQDSIYEEPETDHIYEGLAIETCGEDLYEDLSPYAQVEEAKGAERAEGAEAPWE